ncbi:MAG: ATP-binding cassette domain-containing protein [Schlesneria sp.]
MSSPPVYDLVSVCKKQSDSFSLEIGKLVITTGETLSLVGPTGAGKSTLLRLLTGLELPSSGAITLLGRSYNGNEVDLESIRRIAMVHQRPLMLSESVRYNIEYGLQVRGVKSAQHRSDPMLERLGLTRLVKQDARTLSGGQVQLVAIGRALLVEPEVLLLDEPTAHLDPANVALVEDVIQEQKQRLGMTVVWATHNLFQARRTASRVALILSGRLIEVADRKTFFDCPSDERTRDFVHGKMVY